MSSQAEKLKIGLFVVLSAFLVIGMIIWLGAFPLFESAQPVVAYFTESVQGLESDSPVKFRGVTVGRVKAIRLAPDGLLIEVVMALERKFKLTDDLGVKMNLVGITGLKYLEMDTFKPDQKRETPKLSFEPRYPVIPAYSSDIKEFGSALENIFQKTKAVDVEKISHYLVRVTSRLDHLLSDPKLDTLGSNTADAIKEVKESAKRLNDEIARAQLAKQLHKTFEKTSELLQEGTETARSADRMIRRADNNLNGLSQKLDRSADNLIDFTRMIRLKPSSLIPPLDVSVFGGRGKGGEK
jgi:phospholipid/cholesterol/gamma-HCH transport system substrate-binding protein